MLRTAPRVCFVLAITVLLALPDVSAAGLFRRRCRHRSSCQPCEQGKATQPVMATSGCGTGAICVQRLSAKYMDMSGRCVYAIYDAIQCPFASLSHYDTNCTLSFPRYCATSPCSCIMRSSITPVHSEHNSDLPEYTATNELLAKGLARPVATEEYPGAKKVSDYVIEIAPGKRVRINWLKLQAGRYAGGGYEVAKETPVSPMELQFESQRIMLAENKPAKAFLVHVTRIGNVEVDQDYVVLVTD